MSIFQNNLLKLSLNLWNNSCFLYSVWILSFVFMSYKLQVIISNIWLAIVHKQTCNPVFVTPAPVLCAGWHISGCPCLHHLHHYDNDIYAEYSLLHILRCIAFIYCIHCLLIAKQNLYHSISMEKQHNLSTFFFFLIL